MRFFKKLIVAVFDEINGVIGVGDMAEVCERTQSHSFITPSGY